MKLEWFSPLPPCKSGIADYSRDLAEQLVQRTEVRFWNFWGNGGRGLPSTLRVDDWHPEKSWRALNEGGVPIYHFGNNGEFHWPMWDLISKRPGIVVLHDGALLGLALYIYLNRLRNEAAFLRIMRQYYGLEGAIAASNILKGTASPVDLSPQFTFREYVLLHATAVVVHTRALYDTVAANFDVPVQYMALPIGEKVLDEARRRAPRQNFGNPLRLIVFGHLAPNRRLHSILRAMSESPYRDKLHLIVAGDISYHNDLSLEVERLGLQGRVVFSGFVEEERLTALLSTSDLAINLRNPTMGEASLSQLYLWAFGLPTLVTRTGWYVEQPQNTVVAIDPSDEVNGIKAFFDRALTQPASLLEIGTNGQKWVMNEHAPANYATKVIDFARDVGTVPSWTLAKRLSKRAARALTTLRLHAPTSRTIRAIHDLAGLGFCDERRIKTRDAE